MHIMNLSIRHRVIHKYRFKYVLMETGIPWEIFRPDWSQCHQSHEQTQLLICPFVITHKERKSNYGVSERVCSTFINLCIIHCSWDIIPFFLLIASQIFKQVPHPPLSSDVNLCRFHPTYYPDSWTVVRITYSSFFFLPPPPLFYFFKLRQNYLTDLHIAALTVYFHLLWIQIIQYFILSQWRSVPSPLIAPSCFALLWLCRSTCHQRSLMSHDETSNPVRSHNALFMSDILKLILRRTGSSVL